LIFAFSRDHQVMSAPLDRRDFLCTAGGTLALLLSRSGLSSAQTAATESPTGPPVAFGVIGAGCLRANISTSRSR